MSTANRRSMTRAELEARGEKQRRGFASMPAAKQLEIASLGGKAAHQKGTAHQWTSEEAREAGRKGGIMSRGGHGKAFERSEPVT